MAPWIWAGMARRSGADDVSGRGAGVVIVHEQRRTVGIGAGGAIRVPADPYRLEILLQGVVEEKPSAEGVAQAEQHLYRLHGLDRADDAGQHTQNSRLGAGRSHLGGRRLGEEAAIAGALVGTEHGRLPFEPEDRTVDHGSAEV